MQVIPEWSAAVHKLEGFQHAEQARTCFGRNEGPVVSGVSQRRGRRRRGASWGAAVIQQQPHDPKPSVLRVQLCCLAATQAGGTLAAPEKGTRNCSSFSPRAIEQNHLDLEFACQYT